MLGLGLTAQSVPVMGKTLVQRALTILRRPGIEAHVYLPGIGTLSGLAAANYLDSALTTPATVDNPVGGVIDAIGVINATQPTTAAKPRLERGVRNLLTNSEAFENISWAVALGAAAPTVTSNSYVSPIGTLTADSFTTDSGHDILRAGGAAPVLITGSTYTFSCWVRATDSSPAANVRLTTNNTVAWSTGGSTKVALTTSWQRVSVTWTQVTNTICYCIIGAKDTTGALDATCYGGIVLWGAQLEVGSTASDYSPTTTAAASNPNAGKYSWAFDGGDSLALGSVPFQMSDDHAVIAGFTCSNDASARVVTSVYGAATTAFAAQIYQFANQVIVEWRDDASTTCSPANQNVPVGSTVVISGRRVGNTSTSRKNGGNALTNTGALGAATLNTAAIGVNRFGNNMQGNTGPIIDIKGTLTDSEMLTLERLVASLTPNAPQF